MTDTAHASRRKERHSPPAPVNRAKGQARHRGHRDSVPLNSAPFDTARLSCPIEGCHFKPSPTSLYKHVEQHVRGSLSEDTEKPSAKWLQDHKRAICSNCLGIFATSRYKNHYNRCLGQFPREATQPVEPPPDVPLPTFEEVSNCWQPVLQVVPAPARPEWAKVLQKALVAATREPSESNFVKLALLPKCVLPAQIRAGKNRRKPQVAALCREWEAGNWAQLWQNAKRSDERLRARAGSRAKANERRPSSTKTKQRSDWFRTISLRRR